MRRDYATSTARVKYDQIALKRSLQVNYSIVVIKQMVSSVQSKI